MNYELVRTLLFDVLQKTAKQLESKEWHTTQLVELWKEVGNLANAQKHSIRAELSREEQQYVVHAIWELISDGVVVPNDANGQQGWPFVSITNHGKRVLLDKRPAPYDPDGYLKQFSTPTHNLDSIARFYVDEALGCFRAGRFTACVGMLGTASERLLDLLLDVFSQSLFSAEEQTRLRDATNGRLLRKRYEELRKRIEPKKTQLPSQLQGTLDTYLDGIFNIIRQDRNDVGHPTGRAMTRDEAYAHLYAFPHYCEQMCALIEYLRSNPKSLS